MIQLKLKFAILEKYRFQGDFADVIGFAKSKLSMVLYGRQKITPEEATVWQMLLKCDPSLLEPVTKTMPSRESRIIRMISAGKPTT